MAEILGIGCTHRPVMLRPNEDWTFMMKASLDDPDMPEEMKNPAQLAGEAARGTRQRLGRLDRGALPRSLSPAFRRGARGRSTSSSPTSIVMWGDDQYENFKEDIVPPFAVLAYEDQDIQPWAHRRSPRQPVERAGRQELPRARPQGGGQVPREQADRGRDRCRLCLQAAAPPDGARVREHRAAARRRAARVRLSAGAVFGELLRAAGQRGARAAAAAGDEGRHPQPRPALAQPAPLHAGRRRHRADHGRQPVAGRADGVVELVALVPHREELAALARRAGRPRALRRAGKRATTPSGTATRPTRSRRAASTRC